MSPPTNSGNDPGIAVPTAAPPPRPAEQPRSAPAVGVPLPRDKVELCLLTTLLRALAAWPT